MISLLFFVKYPEPGKVKTRLAESVGPQKAAKLYRRAAEDNVRVVLSCRSEIKPIIFFCPADRKQSFQDWLGPELSYQAQSEGGLGERLANAFSLEFKSGTTACMALGSDTLRLTPEILKSAASALDGHDIVIGPAEDGGYYLIGMNKIHNDLFTPMPWSTSELLKATIKTAGDLDLSVKLLPVLKDLDHEEDIPESWRD